MPESAPPLRWGCDFDAFRNLIAGIYEAIDRVRLGDAAGEGYPTLKDGWRGMAILEAVLLSAREQRWVTVPEHLDLPVAS